MVHPHREPGQGTVTTIAFVDPGCNVLSHLTGSRDAIMAAATTTDDVAMIQRGGIPGKRAVAIVATIIALNMAIIFTGGDLTIVATAALLRRTFKEAL